MTQEGDKGVRWTDKAGAWIGIGASPGALLLGANMAARHEGPAPVIALLLGVALVGLFTYMQGLFGLTPPQGENGTFATIMPRYGGERTQTVLGVALAAGMIGWFGFNNGLGGAAFSALFGLPEWIGPLVLGLGALAITFAGLRVWNIIAWITALSALLLIAVIVARFWIGVSPVTTAVGPVPVLLLDVATFVGFLSVFSVRAPDFTHGLNTHRDLLYCVLSLCVPLAVAALAGVSLWQATGSADLVRVLAGEDGLPIGNLLVTLSVVGPTFTTIYSGSLAIGMVTGLKRERAMLAVAVPGLILALLRFDQQLGFWLALLSAMLPPFVVTMMIESTRRRRGWPALQIPWWTWSVAAMVAIVLTLLDEPLAALVGVVISLVLTGLHLLMQQARHREKLISRL